MSVAGSNSVNNHLPSNGRKRRLNPPSPHDKNQSKLKFASEKRVRLSQEVPDIVNSGSSSSEMAHTISHTETNNKLPFTNSFTAKAGLNNHKKSGQGKKLVIKNRRGKKLCVDWFC